MYEDIAYGLKNNGMDKELIDTKVGKIANLLGISDKILEKSPFELSWVRRN